MNIAENDRLKRELTDRYVVVEPGAPELRRFAGLTGHIKTVNMSGRALVQFEGLADIGWYDIDPHFLKIVEAPKPGAAKEQAEKGGAAKAPPAVKKPTAKTAAAEGKPAAAAGKGGATAPSKAQSILERARAQKPAGAGTGTEAKAGTPAAPAPGKKLSKLEMARMQAEGGATAKTADPAPAKPAAAPEGKKLSKLEQARQQAASGGEPAAKSAPANGDSAASDTVPDEPTPETKPAAAKPGVGNKPLSKLEQARQQGPAKK